MKKINYILLCFLGLHLTIHAQWVQVTSGAATGQLNSVYFPTKDTGYAVGDGLIIKTTDGGNTWVQQAGSFDNMTSVYFTTVNTGVAVGWDGTILKTINGGNKWDTIVSPTNFDNCMSVFFSNKNIGYVLASGSNNNYKTTDGGNTWVTKPYTWTNGGKGSIYFTDTVTGYAAIENAIFKTTDGGTTWLKKDSTSGPYTSIYFPTKDTGYVVTEGGSILKTVNAGNNWTAQVTGTGPHNGLFSVYFTNTDTGYAVGGDEINGTPSIILKTTDGGLNWLPQSIPSPSTSDMLNSVFFTGEDTGYAVGGGTILKTTNGGVAGINKLQVNNKLQVYPNPANNSVQIVFIGTYKIQTIGLFDILGKQIKNEELKNITSTVQIDVSDVVGGVYFLRISTANKITEQKIIIQH